MRPVGAGQAEQVESLVLADVGLRHAGVHPDEADVRVHQQRRRERVGEAARDVVGVALAGARVAAAERLPLQLVAEVGAVLGVEVEHAEAAEEVQLRRRVPVHFGVERVRG